jgi:serine/threonine-protein kinase
VGDLTLPVTDEGAFLIDFILGENPFGKDAYSFFDVYTDKIPPEAFKNRVVLIMPSAPGIMNPISTPSANSSPVGFVLANSLWAMLNNRSIVQPAWDKWATLGLVLFVGAVITLLLPRLKALFALIAFILLFAVIVSGAFYLFIGSIWIHTVYPLLQLVIGYIGVVTLSYFVTETHKTKMEGESAETNRTLALTYQSQGMLDMAFDKLRKVPVDEGVKEILYSLALDFERKRQLNKAANVYAYIEEQDPTYKDAAQKKRKLLQASDSMVYGSGFLGGQTGDAVLSGGSDTRPTLGRYEIMKQLGKGAMGVVYLGQDPRINRTTAIKTFRFTDDFEPEEAERLKETFFREAESAGTLSHPHIVTIYDAGEEQELAYIAMEYLEGEDLQKYTKPNRLLPMRKVLEVVADVADALAYAHDKGIVHRDIKPANIMMLKNGVVKVTDFGIARVVATSQTQTGVVKGTPHYMSPEQISGEKVDGRSDLFSVGVMLYQLLTGKLPFTGSNPAALMHQIMNVPAPNPKTINPKLSNAHVNIINKAMEKDREKRYQTGAQLATHLRTLLKKIDAMMAAKKAKK